jgi:hypothetical protein
MKKLLLFILLLQFSIVIAQFEPIIQEGKIWTENAGDFFEDTYYTITYRYNGTTTINSIEYTNLEIAIGVSNEFSLAGNYREENGQVFLREGNSERLVYDFNLNIGDTFESHIGETFTVTEASMVEYAGTMRKKIVFGDAEVYDCGGTDTGIGEVWIEGIGSLTGLNEQFFNLDLVSCIACYSEDGINFFYPITENFSTEDCRIASLNVDDFTAFKSKLTPNPITKQATLTINTFQPNTTITFYNLLGQRISQKELTSSTTVIARSYFPSSGMYFYQIQN